MSFENIENIWEIDMNSLSKFERGRIYYERAKIVVEEAFSTSESLANAVRNKKFRRDYLANRIGSTPAITSQNLKIKRLLAEADCRIRKVTAPGDSQKHRVKSSFALLIELRSLQRRVDLQQEQLDELRERVNQISST